MPLPFAAALAVRHANLFVVIYCIVNVMRASVCWFINQIDLFFVDTSRIFSIFDRDDSNAY